MTTNGHAVIRIKTEYLWPSLLSVKAIIPSSILVRVMVNPELIPETLIA